MDRNLANDRVNGSGMPDVPIGPDGGESQQPLGDRLNAVGAVFSSLKLASIRISLFERLVFTRAQAETEYGKLPISSLRNTLLTEHAFQVLVFVWKESEYISGANLPIGISKKFPDGRISQWGLARQMTSSVDDLARMNSAIRNIAIAGYVCGLLGRRQLDRTHVEIFGTKLLDELMNAWSIEFQHVIGTMAL